jgi:hypothetical protein
MSDARLAALLFGAAWAAVGLAAALRPERFLAGLAAFPRHRRLGWIFAAVAVCWASYKLYFFPMESYQKIRDYVALLTPLYLYGLIVCLPDLLAARMAACTVLLTCEPMLDAIRWQDSPLRLIITVMVYVLILATMFIAVSPFKFRQWTARLFPDAPRARRTGAVLAAYGGFVVALGLFVFI